MGLHHITAIAGNARQNYNFYTKALGMRLVKKTVNFDDPGTYHFYYGDETGTPGTIITFFPWEGIGRGYAGSGMATNITYSVPGNSLSFWEGRFKQLNIKHGNINERFGEPYLSFEDPDGLKLELALPSVDDSRQGWTTNDVKAEVAIKGFHSVTLAVSEIAPTASVLTDLLGYKFITQEHNRYRFKTDAVDNASIVDIIEMPSGIPGRGAAGTNHHVAFRVKDEKVLMEFREKIASQGFNITPKIDRDYFFSLYFREPGGILFELATDNPGFTRDENVENLGSTLRLPQRYEKNRAQIEAALPPLSELPI